MSSSKRAYKATIITWLELMKFRLSFSVALSALAGFAMYEHAFSSNAIHLLLGVMLLASGTAIINQYQERRTDIKMPRTKNRPIPTGLIKPKWAIMVAFILIGSGAFVLFHYCNIATMYLGLFNVAWYNLIYTPLKKLTAFAVIPGAVCGAIPPVMGWVAAGGELTHPRIMLLAFFFFIWQVPHFWLILLKYGKEYANAGLPSITTLLGRDQLRGITFVWLIASGVVALFLPVFSMIVLVLLKQLIILFVLLYFVFGFWALFKSKGFINYRMAFITVNSFMLIIVFMLIADKIYR